MQLRYNVRMYPTPGQRQALARTFGCARVVFNDALAVRRAAHAEGLPFPKSGDLAKRLITQAKQTPERAWLADAPVGVMQQALRDLDTAYRNFFDSLSGKRKGARIGEPRFRSRRDNRQTARYTRSDRWAVTPGCKLRLPKVGEVRVRWSRELPSDPSSVTVIKDASGRYFASFVVETDGRKVTAPKFFRRAEKKLRKAQQDLARKAKGSANRKKAVVKVARAHARVADARRDFHHKLSTTLIRENQAVHVEDLCVKGLVRTRLAKSVHDAGWSAFVGMLEYKAARYGRVFTRVDRFFPSSQLCSACGFKDGPKPLAVREWTCTGCGTLHDRDVNAARNIRTEGHKVAAGQAETRNARGAQVRPARVPAQRATRTPVRKKQEPTRRARPTGRVQAGIPGL
ncbi:RNA-guided endonuclease InsQ/TnpB family protein [Streptomyces rhizosphaerihabitans]|uniref:RNA-guided endonuclease InsQ/TnpB family protein n=1 Tax=Streptomyces rhizosphaerihabitans TaxID=1266770 RepID=UPI0021BFBB91|nr:transposase [Streptomyces rhizosphaerihabitans]MCT9003767.1 transposase [Streptomyces rhizosphaerihabitans]